jgi:hypothetical protein
LCIVAYAAYLSVFYGIATAGGTLALQKLAPTRETADKLLDSRLSAPFPLDANDVLYMWDASRDYNPAPGLERIQAAVLAINSADDERNPPETGIMERELKRVKNARLFLIPSSESTSGHLTTSLAKFGSSRSRSSCPQHRAENSVDRRCAAGRAGHAVKLVVNMKAAQVLGLPSHSRCSPSPTR